MIFQIAHTIAYKTLSKHLANFGACLIAIACLILPGGCASYVNVPAEDGDSAINAVNLPPTPGVMAAALAYAVDRFPVQRSAVIALPEYSNGRTFEIAAKKIDGSVTAWTGLENAESPYQILNVRIRGSRAVISILLPQDAPILDEKYVLEVSMHGQLNGWFVSNARRFIVTPSRLLDATPPATTSGLVDQNSNPNTGSANAVATVPANQATEPTDLHGDLPNSPGESTETTNATKPRERPLMPIRPADKDEDK